MAQATVKAAVGRGRFISFEGGEGSGKSTQIKILAEQLAGEKLHAIVTREPGGSPGAEIIRHLVLSGMGKLLGQGPTRGGTRCSQWKWTMRRCGKSRYASTRTKPPCDAGLSMPMRSCAHG